MSSSGRRDEHWEASVRVGDKSEGKTAWSGIVEVFTSVGHPKANHAYAWTYRDGNQSRTTMVLKIPPVDSPQTAVKLRTLPNNDAN